MCHHKKCNQSAVLPQTFNAGVKSSDYSQPTRARPAELDALARIVSPDRSFLINEAIEAI